MKETGSPDSSSHPYEDEWLNIVEDNPGSFARAVTPIPIAVCTDPILLPHRGFSTSIASLFSYDGSTSISCCSIVCFGILQSDRNYFLLTGNHPPSCFVRLCLYVYVPLGIFFLAALAATHIPDRRVNETLTTLLLLALMGYSAYRCFQDRMTRIQFRNDLLHEVAHHAAIHNHQTVTRTTNRQIQDAFDAHPTCCGCYDTDGTDDGDVAPSDPCLTGYRWFSSLCCGYLMDRYCQCCGICSVAQEGRETIRFLRTHRSGDFKERRYTDYVTFEPYHEYYDKIAHLRKSKNGDLTEHYDALSLLSRWLLISLLLVLFALGVLAFSQSFQWENLIIVLATFCQSFLILYFVHWKWNRFHLSLDAVIKFFAVGFILSTSLAVVFQLMTTIVARSFMTLLAVALRDDQTSGYGDSQDEDESQSADSGDSDSGDGSSDDDSSDDDLMAHFSKAHPIVTISYYFFNAYLLSALVEELCKYFGYRMVDHPDFIPEQHFESTGVDIGYCGGSSDSESQDHDIFQNENAANVETTPDYDPPTVLGITSRSLTSLGAGITIAMIAVSVGFACCENLIYILLHTGGSSENQAGDLILRFICPVHPLCAALQSIGVCKQVLERDRSVGLGTVLFSGILLHGTFDFFLMLESFIFSRADGDGEITALGASLSVLFSIGLVILGLGYYLRETWRQRERLRDMDQVRLRDSDRSEMTVC